MPLPCVSLNQLSCERHYRPLFKPVTLFATVGECWHIQGANGVGKTTLLKILAGIMSYTGGCQVRCSVSYAGHQPSVYGALSALENKIVKAKIKNG